MITHLAVHTFFLGVFALSIYAIIRTLKGA